MIMELKQDDLKKKNKKKFDCNTENPNVLIKNNDLFKTKHSLLVTGCYDKSIKILNLSKKCAHKTLINNEEVVCILKISNNEIASSSDKNIKIWHLNGENEHNCKTLLGHSDKVFCLNLLSTDASRLMIISGSNDQTIKLWDKNSCSCIKTLIGHRDIIWHILVLKTGEILSSSGDMDRSIRIWSLDSSSFDVVKTNILIQYKRSVLCLILLINGFLGKIFSIKIIFKLEVFPSFCHSLGCKLQP